MKKIFILSIAAIACFASCKSAFVGVTIPPSSLISTATDLVISDTKPVKVTNLMADLEVSPTKISFFYIPTKSVNNGGVHNVVETAIREALISNGNADVLVGLQTQIKYGKDVSDVESITVTGYPAKYVNFRSIDEKYVLEISKMYIDLNLKLRETIGSEEVPNIIPSLVPEVEDDSEKPAAALPLIGKFGRK